MAILSPELYIHKLDDLEWFLVRTSPRCELKAECFFQREGIPYYLPRYNKKYINSFTGKNGKKYIYNRPAVLVPMFPGYIFAALNLDTISESRRERSIIQVCFHTNYTEDELIDDLNKVKDFEFLEKNNQIEINEEIKVGMRVIVRRGPFVGWEGIVERRIDRNLIWLRAQTIGYSMGIEIPAVDCEEVK